MKYQGGAIGEVIFSHRYLLKGRKLWYTVRVGIVLLGTILYQFLLTYLPAYAVGLLTSSRANMFGKLAIYTIALYLIMIAVKRVERTTDRVVNNTRLRKAQEYYVAFCQADYEKIDSSQFLVQYEAGRDSFYDGFHSGFHHMISDFRMLLLGVVGFFVYCVIEAGIDFRIVFLQTGLSSISLLLSGLQKRWMTNHEETWKALDVKLAYLSRKSVHIQNAKDIRLYSMKPWLLKKWDELTKSRLKWYRRERTASFLTRAAGRFLSAVKYLTVYLLVLEQVKHGLEIDRFVLSIGLALGINHWVEEIFHNIQYLQMNSVHVRNTRLALESCSSSVAASPSSQPPQKSGPEIRLEDVTFVFPEGTEPFLEHFNLTIHPGEKLAIVGNNGAGKTTLIKIICGLYRPTSGRLLINGLDTATLSPEEIYLWCTAVFQDFHLLAATLAENVSCMPEEKTDDRRVRSCLKQVGLAQKIESLPKGLHIQMTKELEQDGVLLSGGELQKLMIARCLYTDRPILILDEPTSSLDAVAESQIYQNYYELTKEKTSIFISHRLSSTKFYDRIIHLQNGKIIEEGTHAQLLAKNGAYTKMYETQASYYQEGGRDA